MRLTAGKAGRSIGISVVVRALLEERGIELPPRQKKKWTADETTAMAEASREQNAQRRRKGFRLIEGGADQRKPAS